MTRSGSDGNSPPSLNETQAEQLLEVADGLMERARTLALQTDQLIAALDEAARRLIESGSAAETSPLLAPLRRLPRALAAAESSQGDPAAVAAGNGNADGAATAAEPSVSDGARLLITKMALAGRDHDEIARRLREDFGIEDADDVLKRVGL